MGNFDPSIPNFMNTGYIHDINWLAPTSIFNLLPIVSIPLYLSHHIPGMLKRMGIGMFIILISLVFSSSLNSATYFVNGEKNASESLNVSLLTPHVGDILLSTNIL